MGKKKNTKSAPQATPSLQRVNFLYQAAALVQQTAANDTSERNRLSNLARFYLNCGREVREKSQGRLHPALNRITCRKCRRLFHFGALNDASSDGGSAAAASGTAIPTGYRLNFKGRGSPHLTVTCNDCSNVKRYPANPDYRLAVEKIDAEMHSAANTTKDDIVSVYPENFTIDKPKQQP